MLLSHHHILKFSLFLILVLAFWNPAGAQNKFQKKADSLRLLIDGHPTQDSTWILWQCQWMSATNSLGNYKSNYQLAKECLPKAQALYQEAQRVLARRIQR